MTDPSYFKKCNTLQNENINIRYFIMQSKHDNFPPEFVFIISITTTDNLPTSLLLKVLPGPITSDKATLLFLLCSLDQVLR